MHLVLGFNQNLTPNIHHPTPIIHHHITTSFSHRHILSVYKTTFDVQNFLKKTNHGKRNRF